MLSGFRITLVEDDTFMGDSLVQRLELEGAKIIWVRQAARALGALRTPRAPIDAVICDIRLSDGSGEDLYNTLLATTLPPPFLFITGYGDVEQAVRLLKAGAADYITKPFEMASFLDRLTMLLAPQKTTELPPLLGISPAARRVDKLALKAAATDRNILIRGGPGTGKCLVARRIHSASERRAAPFITVNLAREADGQKALFGPEGALVRAGDGVLFLHDLGRLPPGAQNRLLQALDTGIRVRIIASCSPRMVAGMTNGEPVAELFYRLDMGEIPIPPLAERTDDAVWLMGQMFGPLNAMRHIPLRGIGRLSEEAARGHDWPGGGREVRARLARAIETATGDYLQPVDLFPERIARGSGPMTLAQARDRAERRQIIDALGRSGGQIIQAAKLLQVSRTTLWEKMRKLGIEAQTET